MSLTSTVAQVVEDSYDPGFAVPRIRGDWPLRAACTGAEQRLFFTERWGMGGQQDIQAAKAICAKCEVLTACRDYGLKEKFGIWGGLTEKERRTERRRRSRVAFNRKLEASRRDDPRQFIPSGQRLGATSIPEVDGPRSLPRAVHFAHRIKPTWSDE